MEGVAHMNRRALSEAENLAVGSLYIASAVALLTALTGACVFLLPDGVPPSLLPYSEGLSFSLASFAPVAALLFIWARVRIKAAPDRGKGRTAA